MGEYCCLEQEPVVEAGELMVLVYYAVIEQATSVLSEARSEVSSLVVLTLGASHLLPDLVLPIIFLSVVRWGQPLASALPAAPLRLVLPKGSALQKRPPARSRR